MNTELRGGLIGAGAWSAAQLTAWQSVRNARIVALCDRHGDRRHSLARRFGIEGTYHDAEAMFRGETLDFVDICTRPPSHAALIRLAALHGLPVLCQKPFCASLSEARDVVALCRRLNVRVMVNDNYRWQAWFRRAKELLDSGAVGEPFLARILRRIRFTLPAFRSPQTYLADMSQLIVYEAGVHFLDVFRFLFGEPHSVYARTHRVSPAVKGEDVELIILSYDRMTGLIDHSWASVPVAGIDYTAKNNSGLPRLEVDGSEGTLVLRCDGSMGLYRDATSETCTFPDDAVASSRTAAQQHFVDALVSGKAFETDAADYVKTMALVYGAYVAAQENRVCGI